MQGCQRYLCYILTRGSRLVGILVRLFVRTLDKWEMNSNFLHRTCGPVRGTWDLGRPRPAGPHPTPVAGPCLTLSHGGYAIPDRLQYSRLATHTSTVYTILGGLYNSGVASLQFSAGYTTLDLPYHARPAMHDSTGYAIIYRRASVQRARVPRANAPECLCPESKGLE